MCGGQYIRTFGVTVSNEAIETYFEVRKKALLEQVKKELDSRKITGQWNDPLIAESPMMARKQRPTEQIGVERVIRNGMILQEKVEIARILFRNVYMQEGFLEIFLETVTVRFVRCRLPAMRRTARDGKDSNICETQVRIFLSDEDIFRLFCKAEAYIRAFELEYAFRQNRIGNFASLYQMLSKEI